jgi:hypothetical protein
MQSERERSQTHLKFAITFSIIFLVVGIAWYFTPATLRLLFKTTTPTKGGEFGDQFGATNALFSGLAFAILVWTLWLQRRELQLQRDEIQETQEIMAIQAGTAQEQTAAATQSAFESTFFGLNAILEQTRRSTSVIYQRHLFRIGLLESTDSIPIFVETSDHPRFGVREAIGVEAFGVVGDALKSGAWVPPKDMKDIKDPIAQYEYIYLKYLHATFGQYFRTLYLTLKLIKDKYGTTPTGIRYAQIVRAQLSTPEMVVVFANCESRLGIEKLKPLTEDFHLFDNLRPSDMPEPLSKLRHRSRSRFAPELPPATG